MEERGERGKRIERIDIKKEKLEKENGCRAWIYGFSGNGVVVSPRRQVGDVSLGTVHPAQLMVRDRADQCDQRQGTSPRDLRKTGSNNFRWHTPRQAQASLFPFPTIRGDPIVSDGKQVQLGQSKGNRWAKTSNYTEHAIHWHRPNYTQAPHVGRIKLDTSRAGPRFAAIPLEWSVLAKQGH